MSERSEVAPEHARLGRRAALGIFFLALAVRLVVLAELSGSPWLQVPLGDARHFDQWGQEIAAGDWGGQQVFYQAPLYPYVLGSVYALCGHEPGLVRLLQCVLGALAAVCIAAATLRFATRRAALIAAGLAALYAPAVWYDLQLEKTSLATSLTALLLYSMVAHAQSRPRRAPFLAGLTLGALVLLRENAAVLGLPLALAFGRPAGQRVQRLTSLALGVVLVLAPVAWRNATLGGAFLPTASNAGVNFYIGNGLEADGQYRPLVAGRGHPDYEREDATRIARELSGRGLSPAGVSGFWFALALEEIADEPAHFARLLLHKARLLAQHGEIMDAVALEVFTDESALLRALALFSFGLLLPLSLAGAALAWGRERAGLALASATLVALSIVLFFVVGRFRLGLVPFVLPFAGIALGEWRAPRARAMLALLLGAFAALVAWWPLSFVGDPRATSASNLASEFLRRAEPAQAERWARRARELDPRSAEAAYNQGLALRGLERPDEATEPFTSAMRLEPAYSADCLAELGAIRALAGDEAAARALLQRALALEPTHPAALSYLDTLDEAREESGARRSE